MNIVINCSARRRGGLLLAWLLFAINAQAHDFWIEPGAFRPAAGDEVKVTLRVGQDFSGTSQPLIPNWFSDYSVTGPAGTQPVRGMIGDDPAGHFVATADGSQVIGYRSTRAFVEIDPQTFDKYLEDEGLEWVREVRRERGESNANAREFYSRCAKSVVRSRDAESGAGFDLELGYTLELLPLSDPYALAPDARLPVLLKYEGQPVAGLLVIAFTAEAPQAKQLLRTGTDGQVTVALNRPGTWLIKAVQIIETPPGEDGADWESFWASLTFRLAASD